MKYRIKPRCLPYLIGVAALCSTASLANNVTQFEFDSRGRLVKVSDQSNTEVSYQLDDVGNRTSVADNTVTPSIYVI